MKSNIYPDDVLVLWASRRVGRPVKWTATRSESLLLDTQARDQVVYGELALDETGSILAVRARAYQALGAYWWAAITAPLFFSLMLIPSLYDVQTVDLSTQAVFTNTAPTSVYRGAGRPEAIYLIERLLDAPRASSASTAVEIRRRNLIKPVGAALSDADAPQLRQRRVRADDGPVPRHRRLEGLRSPPQGERAGRQAARTLGHALYRARRRVQRPHGAAVRSERPGDDHRRHAFARPGARDRVRAARLANGSACRSRPSNTSRATPRRCRSAAARLRRAARWSAAWRCASPPTPSSPRPRTWPAC